MKGNPKLPFLIAVAFAVAVITALAGSRAPDYRVLYSNLSDRDGGAIIAALQQANVPQVRRCRRRDPRAVEPGMKRA